LRDFEASDITIKASLSARGADALKRGFVLEKLKTFAGWVAQTVTVWYNSQDSERAFDVGIDFEAVSGPPASENLKPKAATRSGHGANSGT
jgi:hypothetical protein